MTTRDTIWNLLIPLKAGALHAHTQTVKALTLTQLSLNTSHQQLHNLSAGPAGKICLLHHVISAKKPEHSCHRAPWGNGPFTVYTKKHLVLWLDITTTIKTPAEDQEDHQGRISKKPTWSRGPKRSTREKGKPTLVQTASTGKD